MEINNRGKHIGLITIFAILAILATAHIASAELVLDRIQYDPAIIAAGDEVDIVVEFHEEGPTASKSMLNNPDYTFEVQLLPDDTLTKDYVTVTDAEGDDLRGTISIGENYNKRFRIKVNNNAPAGDYEFKLQGQWYYKGNAEPSVQTLRFRMPVKKEGIILDISTIQTQPAEIRPGDNYIKLTTSVENVGEKDAKSVEISLNLPKSIQASYSDAGRKWIGRLNAGESKEAIFYIDIDENASSKTYPINYSFSYMDLDDNTYDVTRDVPLLVKPKPNLEVISSKGEGLAGSSGDLYVTVKNIGSESAESVDVRLLKQNSQPFSMDVRSDYIGELAPGEEGLAVFHIKINPDATIKDHDFKLMIRAKGDSDEGDDNIYVYERRAGFGVTGKAPNYILYAGIIAALLVITLITVEMLRKRKRK